MHNMINEAKIAFGIIASGLVFLACIPYFRSIATGKTKPHIYTWLIWIMSSSIMIPLQITHGAGAGAFMTITAVIMCFIVLILGFKNGKRQITKIDTVFLILALIALVFWLFVKQPLVSVILLMAAELIGFAPTVRKTWKDPYSEPLFFYIISAIRFGLGFLAIREYSLITALNPGLWFLTSSCFLLMLIMRRRCAPSLIVDK